MSAPDYDDDMPQLFKRYASDNARLFLVEVDGVMWASNTYWAVVVPDDQHPIAQLLALYNLPLAPGVLSSGETLRPDPASDATKSKAQDSLATLVRTVPEDLEPITRHCLNGQPLYAYDDNLDRILALFQLPGGRFVAVTDRMRDIVERDSHGQWHGGPDPLKPIYLRHEGKTTGLLMGVRCQASAPPEQDS